MKDNMPVKGYFVRAKVFGYIILAIVVFIVFMLSYNFFTD